MYLRCILEHCTVFAHLESHGKDATAIRRGWSTTEVADGFRFRPLLAQRRMKIEEASFVIDTLNTTDGRL